MSYKIGLLLSTVFLMSVFLLGGDLCLLNASYQQLDAVAMAAIKNIEMEGCVSDKTIDFVKSEGATFSYWVDSPFSPKIGDMITFEVKKSYTPLILQNSTMNLRVRRSCIVGFYIFNQ
ncbi:MAG: hypothetical protein SOV58_06435 [Candidatus Enteromonas sp.]|nr:hypothetical protein [Candidatus Enteromonas sp.]